MKSLFKSHVKIFVLAASLLGAAGCASYSFHSSVPENLRTLSVPVFLNESEFPELNTIITQYTLREIQREGTLKIMPPQKAALILRGTLLSTRVEPVGLDRNYGSRANEYRYRVTVNIKLMYNDNARHERYLNKKVSASTTFLTQGDMLTGMRDAYHRIAKEISRSIVDAVLAELEGAE